MVEKKRFMKRFKSTVVIFLLFVGLTSYYFLAKTEKKTIYIFDFKKENIKALELIDMSDITHYPCDELASELTNLSVERDVTKDVQNFRHYGLSIPKYKIKFNVGDKSHTLCIGNKSPTEDFYFVREEGKRRIWTVDAATIDKFTKKSGRKHEH